MSDRVLSWPFIILCDRPCMRSSLHLTHSIDIFLKHLLELCGIDRPSAYNIYTLTWTLNCFYRAECQVLLMFKRHVLLDIFLNYIQLEHKYLLRLTSGIVDYFCINFPRSEMKECKVLTAKPPCHPWRFNIFSV